MGGLLGASSITTNTSWGTLVLGNAVPEMPQLDANRVADEQQGWTLFLTAQGQRTWGDADSAFRSADGACRIFQRLIKADPTDSKLGHGLAMSLGERGLANLARGKLAPALEDLMNALLIQEPITQAEPDNPKYRGAVAILNAYAGRVLQRQGDSSEALKRYATAIEIYEALLTEFPGNLLFQSQLSFAFQELGFARSGIGDRQGALSAYEAGLAIDTRMADLDPANPSRQSAMVAALGSIGEAKLALDDRPGAIAAFEAGLAIAKTLADADRPNTLHLHHLSRAYLNCARVELESKPEEAFRKTELAIKIARMMVRFQPEDMTYREHLIAALDQLGLAHESRGESAKALPAYKEALALAEELVASGAADPMYQARRDRAREAVQRLEDALIEFN